MQLRLQFQSFFKGSEVLRSEFSRSEVSRSEFSRSEFSRSEVSRSEFSRHPYIGMCDSKGFGFSAILVINLNRVWVLYYLDMGVFSHSY